MKPKPIAEIVCFLGYTFLNVANVTVAGEGDICREDEICGNVWTAETLKLAARKINKQHRNDYNRFKV